MTDQMTSRAGHAQVACRWVSDVSVDNLSAKEEESLHVSLLLLTIWFKSAAASREWHKTEEQLSSIVNTYLGVNKSPAHRMFFAAAPKI